MNPHPQVGKTVANWTPIFANWIQSANACQLDVLEKQIVTDQSASWQVGRVANLPTEATNCFCTLIRPYPVGENSPLPTGEVDTPDWTSGCPPRSRTCPVACDRVVQVEVAQ